MGNANDVLAIERRWLDAGTREVPDGSNRVRGITDQPGRFAAAWCDQFQMQCLMEAGVMVGPGKYGSASVITTFNWYGSLGRTFTNPRDARPGDLIGFHFTSGHSGLNHIGMVESVRPDGLVTIEGNVGNAVRRQFRGWGGQEFARPHYDINVPVNPTVGGVVGLWRRGMQGDFVKNIQRVVGVTPDGQFGPATEAAVKVWQQKLHIQADGVWGAGTQAATERFFEFISGLNKPQAPPPGGDILTALLNASQTIQKLGSSGDNVKLLQTLLNQHHGLLKVDGQFGPSTEKAVKNFQTVMQLPVDGVVGPHTWYALLR